jgi:cytochrome b involved in lipid metabolism
MGSAESAAPAAGTPSSRVWTRAEVRTEAASSGKVLIILDNVVYDVTSFAREHPGGDILLTENTGRDVTVQFESARHTPGAKAQMHKFAVGVLCDADVVGRRGTV